MGNFTDLTSSSFQIAAHYLEYPWLLEAYAETVRLMRVFVKLETYDKRIVIIPNYKLIDALITNISSEPARRIVMEIGLTYDTTPEKMQKAVKILQKIPHKVPDVEENGLNVAFANFADSSLVIRFVYFIRKGADIFGTRSTVNFEILRSF